MAVCVVSCPNGPRKAKRPFRGEKLAGVGRVGRGKINVLCEICAALWVPHVTEGVDSIFGYVRDTERTFGTPNVLLILTPATSKLFGSVGSKSSRSFRDPGAGSREAEVGTAATVPQSRMPAPESDREPLVAHSIGDCEYAIYPPPPAR